MSVARISTSKNNNNEAGRRGESALSVGNKATTKAVEALDVFRDPRDVGDRRIRHNLAAIPVTGCRRIAARRTAVYIKNDEWWMKRNYNNLV